MNFSSKLAESIRRTDSLLCVGLDPGVSKMPERFNGDQLLFNKYIIEATHEVASSYKPNAAFYEARGAVGVQALKDTCDYLRLNYPEIPIILDAKRGDIGNTNAGYTEYIFNYLGADAVTVAPYMGSESLGKFLQWEDKGIIVLCRTSNSGSGEFQELEVEGEPLYQKVARAVATGWNARGNCGLVVGATYPEELAKVRDIIGPDMPLLVPGVGAQGGDVEASVRAGVGANHAALMISASRGIIFDDDPEAAATKLRIEINKYRGELVA
jgi:orotidine-5'-phosphate decarboxylase